MSSKVNSFVNCDITLQRFKINPNKIKVIAPIEVRKALIKIGETSVSIFLNIVLDETKVKIAIIEIISPINHSHHWELEN